ncbi:glycosyltransferase [Halobacillus litoralis]|uniref:glycosyltransferase n=1 Tax=Halobacillus litoralis TaxID=45668 RepID=UPI0021E57B96|nr:glycosyltransferase [Halobacillus litoralis]
MHQFTKNWVESGVEVTVVRVWPYYYFPINLLTKQIKNKFTKVKSGEFELDGVKVVRLPIGKVPKFYYSSYEIRSFSKKVLEIINNKKPDVVISHMISPSIYIAHHVSQCVEAPHIHGFHYSDLLELTRSKLRFSLYKRVEKYVEKLAFRSEKLEHQYSKLPLKFRSEQDMVVIPSGINDEDIIEPTTLVTKNQNASRVKILIACKLIRQKKVDNVIEALSSLKNLQNFQLTIAGDGPELNRLKKLVRKCGLEEEVDFKGFIPRSEVLKLMEVSHIFIMISSPETFGVVYLEAMAKGCLTIGSKGEGIDGVIEDEINGFLCKPGDIQGIRTKLSEIFTLDNNLKKRIVANGVKTAQNMSDKRVSSNYLNEINKTIVEFNS